jgi:aspartyl-tRNA(Asn)/glutamyl-tRNA(Gln) amidotransferase subunit C
VHIDHTILEKLEKLSHLRVDESKKEEIIGQLSEIVSYIENLNELDTDHLDASFSTLEGGTPMREDIPLKQPEIAQDILSHAPRQEDDFFVVPAIIE